ncbi:hypothetical protein AMK16_11180 [Streptomyces sp. CB00455]|uniref:hypothetical protein n=1 Tax=Streptomyces sp. CB00455 TaxID=1703927 RepID=UPI00093D99C1|nr:hypothetical protein [Streptomyces sp. CB00455]OKK20950.1 hypothetical protein AMK16_11180 [Streptomyces sp. CB00455]
MSQNFPQPPEPDDFTAAPPAPAPARSGNLALGVAAAVVVALVTAGIYGAIIGASRHEIGYAAVGVGALIGFAAGKLGGPNPVVPVVSALLSVAAVFAGQILGIAVIDAHQLGVSMLDMLDLGVSVSLLFDVWKQDADPLTYLFFAVGAYAAFQTARKTAA